MLNDWLRNERGVAGLAGGAAVWGLSAFALSLSMRANLAADDQGRLQQFAGTDVVIRHLHGTAVLWGAGFTALQLLSFLMFAFVLRACYRLRSAVCFSAGAGLVMAGDVLGLFVLMCWVGLTMGWSN